MANTSEINQPSDKKSHSIAALKKRAHAPIQKRYAKLPHDGAHSLLFQTATQTLTRNSWGGKNNVNTGVSNLHIKPQH